MKQIGDTALDDRKARERWKHEDDLINQRVTWMGITQGLLFTAYGATFQLSDKPWHSKEKIDLFLAAIPEAGIWIALVVFVGVFAAGLAMLMIYLRSDWPSPGVSWFTSTLGWLCALAMPWIFVIVWLRVLGESLLKFVLRTGGSIFGLLF